MRKIWVNPAGEDEWKPFPLDTSYPTLEPVRKIDSYLAGTVLSCKKIKKSASLSPERNFHASSETPRDDMVRKGGRYDRV